jgi:nucleoid DNA-binding protein
MNAFMILLVLSNLVMISSFLMPTAVNRVPQFTKLFAAATSKTKSKKEKTSATFGMTAAINSMAESTGFSRADVKNLVEEFLEIIRCQVFVEEKPLRINSFGTFKVSNRKARQGFDFQTKTKTEIPARKVLTFRASKVLRAVKSPEETSK